MVWYQYQPTRSLFNFTSVWFGTNINPPDHYLILHIWYQYQPTRSLFNFTWFGTNINPPDHYLILHGLVPISQSRFI